MTDLMTKPTTITSIGCTMFSVADQDAALAFYTEQLGWEVRADVRFGEDDAMRWLEVAPPGSVARLALCPPMNGTPGGAAIGVETPDVHGEHARLAERGLAVGDVQGFPGAPTMFSLEDPDGNWVWVVETPAS